MNNSNSSNSSSNAAMNISSDISRESLIANKDSITRFKSFVYNCSILPFKDSDGRKISLKCLRDTGCSISLLKRGTLPETYLKFLNGYVMITGVGSSHQTPLYSVNLCSPFGRDTVVVGLIDDLPVTGIDLLLGNEYLGSRVKPGNPIDSTLTRCKSLFSNKNEDPIVMCSPCEHIDNEEEFMELFPGCVVTRAISKKEG